MTYTMTIKIRRQRGWKRAVADFRMSDGTKGRIIITLKRPLSQGGEAKLKAAALMLAQVGEPPKEEV